MLFAFVDRIADAVGGVYRPTHIRRVAQAEADAAKIHALARIEVSEIERRAMDRLVHEEGRKQENIERITGKRAVYTVVQKGAHYDLHCPEVAKLARELELDRSPHYLELVLRKYF